MGIVILILFLNSIFIIGAMYLGYRIGFNLKINSVKNPAEIKPVELRLKANKTTAQAFEQDEGQPKEE